jgi:hypothetical protein
VGSLEEAGLQVGVVQVVRERPAQPSVGLPAAVLEDGPQADPRAAPTFPVIEPCNSMTRLVAGLPKSCKRRTRPGLRIAAFDEAIPLASLLLGVPWPESSTLSILEGRLEIATQS